MSAGPRNERAQPRRERIQVGERQAGGQVTAWLEDGIPGAEPRLGVNAAYLTGISVSISTVEARRLAYGLLAMTDPDPRQ
jgi:hypothetical protein